MIIYLSTLIVHILLIHVAHDCGAVQIGHLWAGKKWLDMQ